MIWYDAPVIFGFRRASLRAAMMMVALAAFVPATGAAQDPSGRVVVDRFGGPRGARLRGLLVSDLERAGWQIVPDRELEAARRSLGVGRSPSADEIVQLCRELGARALIRGRSSRARRRWRVSVDVHDGSSGREVGSESWAGRTSSSIDAIGRGGARRVDDELQSTQAPGAPVVVATPDENPPWYAGGDVSDDEVPPGDEEEEARPSVPSSRRYDSFRISLSGGSLWRSMQTTALVYSARRGGSPADPATGLVEENRGYTSAGIGHAELGVEGELYPGALGDQPFPFLGVLVSFRHSAFLTSFGCRRTAAECSGDGRIQIGTDQLDLSLGLRGRYRFGESRGDFELFAEFLYGYSTFTLDTVALQEIDFDSIVPPMEYQHVDLGLGFNVGVVPDALYLGARFDYRIGVGMGAAARNVWGTDTGPADGFLLGVEIKHEANWLTEGLFLALRVEYFQAVTNFRGQVGCAVPGGCTQDPAPPPWMDDSLWELWPVQPGGDLQDLIGGISDGVTDHYVRWGLYLGYAFR